jgi:hypothetical protein
VHLIHWREYGTWEIPIGKFGRSKQSVVDPVSVHHIVLIEPSCIVKIQEW